MNATHEWKRAVDRFWSDVKALLVEQFHYTESEAQQGIDTYKQEIAKHHFEDAVYNRGEEHTATVVDGLIRNGVPISTA